jgi:pimeloyl-ACP methyl ester carboxylesterase
MALAQVGDIQLDYERTGAGEPLLTIMGMSGTALHWGEPFLQPLRESLEVITYDHRGVGASSRLEGPLSIALMARDAAGLLDALGITGAHVLGISMGGMIAQDLALSRPDLVRTLTIGCSYCGGPGSALPGPEVMGRLTEAMLSGDRQKALRAGWEANISPAMRDDRELYERYLAVAAQRAVAVPVVMAQLQAAAAHDTSSRLGELEMPTLVVHGTEDEMLPVQNGRLIASLIPGSRLEILDPVGHLFFWERPQQSAQLIISHALAQT